MATPPVQRTELSRLAEELLEAMRTVAAQAAAGRGETGGRSVAQSVSDTALKSAQFAAAAANSPGLAEIARTSPPLAALTLVSEDLARIASQSPQLAELAVMSPGVARLAAKAPELIDLAVNSPALVAMLEAALSKRSGGK